MAVHAKFYVAETTKFASSVNPAGWAEPAPHGKVVLRPVTRGADNKEWASSTPSGEIQMTVIGPALAQFEAAIGQEVDILFSFPD